MPDHDPDATSASSMTLEAALRRQRQACLAEPAPNYESRRADLRQLRRFVYEQRDAICEAINADYGQRSRHETLIIEILPTLKSIDHALKHLHRWMAPQRRRIDRMAFGLASNRVLAQPLGVVGIIVPWNFPLHSSLVPLVSVLAAGNRAMIKMSENSRHLAQLMIDRLPAYLPSEKLQVFDETGGLGAFFSQLPFDHLLFTGSCTTGRSVMASAAANLCPVTLELGGKSPAVVAADFPLETAAERILYVKCLNAGQVCTAVDHVFVPNRSIEQFVHFAQIIVQKRYPRLEVPDYTAIINDRAFQRLTSSLLEAERRGARLVQLLPGPPFDRGLRKIAPHIVLNPPADCELMNHEIFGPILPVIGYESLQTVVEQINLRPRPLAFYPFSNDRTVQDMLVTHVMSGGVSINDALFHAGQDDLPFGGVGESGMGHYHGHEGFQTFSKMRPIFRQARFAPATLLAPPYNALTDRLLKFLVR